MGMIDSGTTLTLVVPVYNEEARVTDSVWQLVDYIKTWPHGSRLIFVDDGSDDSTPKKIDEILHEQDFSGATLERLDHLGKGAAVRHGLIHSETTLAAFCDLDLATPLNELTRLIMLSAQNDSLIIGSRSIAVAEVVYHESLKRRIAGKAFNKLVRMLLCPGITDTQCGAKAATTRIWHNLLVTSVENGFAWDVEVVAQAIHSKIEIIEVPVKWTHDKRSRVNVGRDGMNMVLSVLKIKGRIVTRGLLLRCKSSSNFGEVTT